MPISRFEESRPDDLYVSKAPGEVDVWRPVGWITTPAVILDNVKTGERRYVVAGSYQANEYHRLVVADGAERGKSRVAVPYDPG